MRKYGEPVIAKRLPSIRGLPAGPHAGFKFDKGVTGPAFGSNNLTEADSKAALDSVEFWDVVSYCGPPAIALTISIAKGPNNAAAIAVNAKKVVLLKPHLYALRVRIIFCTQPPDAAVVQFRTPVPGGNAGQVRS